MAMLPQELLSPFNLPPFSQFGRVNDFLIPIFPSSRALANAVSVLQQKLETGTGKEHIMAQPVYPHILCVRTPLPSLSTSISSHCHPSLYIMS